MKNYTKTFRFTEDQIKVLEQGLKLFNEENEKQGYPQFTMTDFVNYSIRKQFERLGGDMAKL